MASSSGLGQPQIPVLNGKKYDHWAIKMRTLFHSQDVWNFVLNGYPKLVDQAAELALTNEKKISTKREQE